VVHHSAENRYSYWLKPQVNFFMLNFDRVLEGNNWCVGGIFRDFNGEFILGFAGKTSENDKIGGLLMAILHGLTICIGLDIYNIILESKLYIELKSLLDLDGSNCFYPLFYIRRNIRDLFVSVNCSFIYVPSATNSCA